MLLFFFLSFHILKFKRRLVIFSTSFIYVSIIASNYMEIMEGYMPLFAKWCGCCYLYRNNYADLPFDVHYYYHYCWVNGKNKRPLSSFFCLHDDREGGFSVFGLGKRVVFWGFLCLWVGQNVRCFANILCIVSKIKEFAKLLR